MKVKSESEVAQSCPTPSDPMDCSLPGSSVHGIFQARVLEWGAIAFSSGKDYYYKNIFLIFIIRYNIFVCYTESYNICMGELLFEDPYKTFFTVRNVI